MLVWRFRFANSVTYSGGAGILNDLRGVLCVREHRVQVVHEVTIVDQASTVLDLVLVEESLGLLLRQIHTKGADACAELERKVTENRVSSQYHRCQLDLQLPLRRLLCEAYRSQ